ncbi:hypothetical protein [Actinacidiphila reveromycinica]|uniref:hypothetical protein n=1 Tax=Actinacidiphila reveromycinica TaxID=659352 RepID=UPI001920FD7F|nr:hypothetical protein [Streptomyces sp. SN-593]
MPEWPGRSARDRRILTYLGTHLVLDRPGVLVPLPAVLLLGPRGSGKTTTLAVVEEWARAHPFAGLDLEAMRRSGATVFDALVELAFQLQEGKEGFRPLHFPSFTLLLMALRAAVTTEDRDRAIREMGGVLASATRQGYDLESLEPFIEGVATAIGGLPVGWIAQILPGIRAAQRLRARVRLNKRIDRAAAAVGAPRAGAGFLVGANRLFHGNPVQRRRVERMLYAAFRADLVAAYTHRHNHDRRTSACLVTLDNVDTELGDALLELVLGARDGPGAGLDPLLVVAAARRPPGELIGAGGGPVPASGDTAGWTGGAFAPVPAGRLHVGRLRDLDAGEVEAHAKRLIRALPDEDQPSVARASAWLGWNVYTATRGQPAATGALLDALARFPAATPWEERLERWPEIPARPAPGRDDDGAPPTVAEAVLDVLLADCDTGLRRVLPRAAAAASHVQAGAAPGLWQGVSGVQQRAFATGGEVAFHPAARYLLLRRLDADTHAQQAASWDGAHAALAAAALDDEGAAGEDAGRVVAYHDLARGDLAAAADYLRGRLPPASPVETWCRDLSYLQRAPARRPAGGPEPAQERYERLVGDPPGDGARRAIVRLLAAGWITAHPGTDPYARWYEDPFGDPYAELYDDIAHEFRNLHDVRGIGGAARAVFAARAREYDELSRGKPW